MAFWDPSVHLLETVLAATVVGTLIYAKQRVIVLQSRFLLFIGDISYSIYLFHYVVVCTMAKLFAVMLPDSVDTVTLSILLASVTFAITVPLAWLSFTYVEKPGIRLGKQSVRQTQAILALRRAGGS